MAVMAIKSLDLWRIGSGVNTAGEFLLNRLKTIGSLVCIRLIFMTADAIQPLRERRRWMRILTKITLMTVDTRQFSVRRMAELLAIDMQIDKLAALWVTIGQRFHAMTAQAIAVIGAKLPLNGGGASR